MDVLFVHWFRRINKQAYVWFLGSAALAEKAILERDSVINELRESVAESAQHVRHLQQQLTDTTSAVIDSGGQHHQVLFLSCSESEDISRDSLLMFLSWMDFFCVTSALVLVERVALHVCKF